MKTKHILFFGLITLGLLSFTNNGTESKILCLQDGTRDGSSYEKAIIIKDTTESKGIKAEYAWLSEHYPGYKMKKQALSYNNGKPYDILYIKYKGKKNTSTESETLISSSRFADCCHAGIISLDIPISGAS